MVEKRGRFLGTTISTSIYTHTHTHTHSRHYTLIRHETNFSSGGEETKKGRYTKKTRSGAGGGKGVNFLGMGESNGGIFGAGGK